MAVLLTEWNEFRSLDLRKVRSLLKAPLVVDLGDQRGEAVEHGVQMLQDFLVAFHVASRIAPAPDPDDPCRSRRRRLAHGRTRKKRGASNSSAIGMITRRSGRLHS